MSSNNAVKKTQLGTDLNKNQDSIALTINLQSQQIDVVKLKPEAKSRLIGYLASQYEKNNSSIHIINNKTVDRSSSDFDQLISLIREELNPQAMSEAGKTKLIHLLHNQVEQQDHIITKGIRKPNQTKQERDKPPAQPPIQPHSVKPLETAKLSKPEPSALATPKLDKTRAPIDLTDANGQDENLSDEKESLWARILNTLKPFLNFKKPSPEKPLHQPKSETQFMPSQGMPVYEGHEDDDEGDEDDEIDNEQLFELKDHYNGHSQSKWPTESRDMIIEVLHLNQGEVIDVTYLEKGKSYQINSDGKKIAIAKNKGNNKCQYFFNSQKFKGELRLRSPGGRLAVEPLTSKSVWAGIPAHADVCIRNGQDSYVIRANFPLKAPQVKEEEKNYQVYYKSLASSTGFHLFILLALAIFVSYTPPETKLKAPEFVKIEIPKDVPPKVEKPKAKPKAKVAKPKPKVKPKAKPKAKPKTKAKSKPKPKAKPKAGGGKKGNIKKRDVKKSGLLAALGSKSGKTKPRRSLANVTSLDAVSSSASSARLKVSGLKAKVGGSRMTLPTGELITSKGAADVLRSGGVGGKGSVAALTRGGTGTQAVAGRVSASMSKRVKIKGGLSREQVKRVIDAHMDDVTYCYETSLMSTPGLAGKIVFEWKVQPSGKVGGVNIKSSTVRSDEIHSCIKSAIKTWKFPQPSGGEAVFVSYPFIFDTVGF